MNAATALTTTASASSLDRIKALVLDSVSSPLTRAMYGKALDDFLRWYGSEPRSGFSKAIVQAHRAYLEGKGYSASTINQRLSAIRKLALEAADNGLMPSELAAGIGRVRGAKIKGVRTGNWLTKPQAEHLLTAPDASTLKGKRDRAILALLIGCGLRRSEVAGLRIADVQQRDGRWVIVDLIGKHGRVRTVPMPAWVKALLDHWTVAATIADGCVFRSVNRGGRLNGSSLTAQAIMNVVTEYASTLALDVRPHDLRRTCAKLCRAAGGDLQQLQLLLGHASVQTTERYLGTHQNLSDAPNDRVTLHIATK
jgi:integrase